MKKKALLLMMFLMFISTNALSQNLIQGKISGVVQAGISVELYKTSCGGDTLVDTFTTSPEGYYAFGCLVSGDYKVIPDNASYVFTPEIISIEIPQTKLQSYDFTASVCISAPEMCDEIDNDCDGVVDNGLNCLEFSNRGACYDMRTGGNYCVPHGPENYCIALEGTFSPDNTCPEGSDTTADCKGFEYGASEFDMCGICGGDGTTCLP